MTKWFCGLITAAALALVNNPLAAQTNGPYYATPSWDQQLPVSTRFIVLTNWGTPPNAAVLDRETGLVWQQSPGGQHVQHDDQHFSIFDCQSTAFNGRYGWRLPTVEELATLADPNNSSNLFAGAPFVIGSATQFWTASTPTGFAGFGYAVDFGTTPAPQFTDPATILSFWCVRGYQATSNPQ